MPCSSLSMTVVVIILVILIIVPLFSCGGGSSTQSTMSGVVVAPLRNGQLSARAAERSEAPVVAGQLANGQPVVVTQTINGRPVVVTQQQGGQPVVVTSSQQVAPPMSMSMARSAVNDFGSPAPTAFIGGSSYVTGYLPTSGYVTSSPDPYSTSSNWGAAGADDNDFYTSSQPSCGPCNVDPNLDCPVRVRY